MQLPERITAGWINSLGDKDLMDAESRLHELFSRVERQQKKLRGSAYDLMRGPEPLLTAWQRWSMVSAATRARGLHPRYGNRPRATS